MPEPSLIPIHHCRQIADGYCLPACTQMVLAALGIDYTQESLGKLLGTDPEAGTPGSRIRLLESASLKVDYREADWQFLTTNLARRVPVITLIDTADLSYWDRSTLHAVVVVGTDQDAKTIWLHDPDQPSGPIPVSRNEFEMAWIEMSCLSGTIQKRKS